jgi:hypothetical protein
MSHADAALYVASEIGETQRRTFTERPGCSGMMCGGGRRDVSVGPALER